MADSLAIQFGATLQKRVAFSPVVSIAGVGWGSALVVVMGS
jgi:hypothetical protein